MGAAYRVELLGLWGRLKDPLPLRIRHNIVLVSVEDKTILCLIRKGKGSGLAEPPAQFTPTNIDLDPQ